MATTGIIAHGGDEGKGRRTRLTRGSAGTFSSRSALCSACNRRFRQRDLIEVLDEDHHLFDLGERVCESCAINHGVL